MRVCIHLSILRYININVSFVGWPGFSLSKSVRHGGPGQSLPVLAEVWISKKRWRFVSIQGIPRTNTECQMNEVTHRTCHDVGLFCGPQKIVVMGGYPCCWYRICWAVPVWNPSTEHRYPKPGCNAVVSQELSASTNYNNWRKGNHH